MRSKFKNIHTLGYLNEKIAFKGQLLNIFQTNIDFTLA